MPNYDYECPKCNAVKEINCSYSDKPQSIPCDCGGVMGKAIRNFALGAGMYHQKTTFEKKSDMLAELKSYGIEKISASTQNFESTFQDLKKNKSQVTDQMKAGAERQQKILAEKVKASTPSASEVRRLEKIYEKKSNPKPKKLFR